MIEINNISKNFEDVEAVNNISMNIEKGSVFGLIGTNGAGKSTLLRILVGIIKPDKGEILIDKNQVYENNEAKGKFFYISDEQFFLPNSKPIDMAKYYNNVYENFSIDKFNSYMEKFHLPNRKIKTYSKGMKKQLSVILGVASNTDYIICDETFDGLDPVMRQGVKSLFSAEIEERKLTPIIASHNLREIEDICDDIGVLYKGGVILSNNLDELKLNTYKMQCVFENTPDFSNLDIIVSQNKGSLYTLTIRGDIEHIEKEIEKLNPTFYEVIGLTLEEIFIIEMEAKGYDFKNIIQ